MTTAREYLDRYNVAATKLGRPTIKSWKSSTTAIQVKCNAIETEAAAFEATQEELAAQQTRQEVIADRTEPTAEDIAAQEASAEAMRKAATDAAKKTIKRSKVATKAAKSGFSAAQIIAEFGIAPKIGRALLRKHNVKKDAAAIRAFFKSRAK